MDTDRLIEFLTQEGFRPTLAGAGELRFKYEGGHCAIRLLPDDDQHVSVSHTNFWELPVERPRTSAA